MGTVVHLNYNKSRLKLIGKISLVVIGIILVTSLLPEQLAFSLIGIAFDTETTSTDQMQADLVGISLAVSGDEGYYIPIGHKEGKQLPLKQVLAALEGPMTDPSIQKMGHNIKYDYILLARSGLKVHPLNFDSMIMSTLK